MAEIPESHRDLLTGTHLGYLATLMPGGDPQVTPVWVDFDGTDLLVNSAIGRQKDRNIERDARVAVSVTDHANQFRHIEVRGVAERVVEGAQSHAEMLRERYMNGKPYVVRDPDEVRVIYRIRAERVSVSG
jgi:PPOX class probable F420-dependent enzyme